MYYTVYKTTNLINGKYYIGKHITENPNDSYLGTGKIILDAIKKYGRQNFVKQVIAIFDYERQMNLAESILVVPDRETNYNIAPGGKGGFGHINSSKELKEKAQIKAKEAIFNKYGVENISQVPEYNDKKKGKPAWNTGKKCPEHSKRMRKKWGGKNNPVHRMLAEGRHTTQKKAS